MADMGRMTIEELAGKVLADEHTSGVGRAIRGRAPRLTRVSVALKNGR
jgi:hypothetical protein